MAQQDPNKSQPHDDDDRNKQEGSHPWQDQPLADVPDYAWREHEESEPAQQPQQQGYHNPQYEWAQGDHSSYPSGGFRLVRWIFPIAIVAMVGIYLLTR